MLECLCILLHMKYVLKMYYREVALLNDSHVPGYVLNTLCGNLSNLSVRPRGLPADPYYTAHSKFRL